MTHQPFRLQAQLFDNTHALDVFHPERAWFTAGKIGQDERGLLTFFPTRQLEHFHLPRYAPALLTIEAFAEKIASSIIAKLTKLDDQESLF